MIFIQRLVTSSPTPGEETRKGRSVRRDAKRSDRDPASPSLRGAGPSSLRFDAVRGWDGYAGNGEVAQ